MKKLFVFFILISVLFIACDTANNDITYSEPNQDLVNSIYAVTAVIDPVDEAKDNSTDGTFSGEGFSGTVTESEDHYSSSYTYSLNGITNGTISIIGTVTWSETSTFSNDRSIYTTTEMYSMSIDITGADISSLSISSTYTQSGELNASFDDLEISESGTVIVDGVYYRYSDIIEIEPTNM